MRKLNKRLIAAVVVVSASAGVLWQMAPRERGGDVKKRLGKVRRGDLVQRVTVSGQVQPLRRTIFVAPYAGYIQKIYVTIGQLIPKGAPVLSITSSLQSPEPVFPIRAPFAGTVVDVQKSEGGVCQREGSEGRDYPRGRHE
ncbi:MAG: hypothetical protein HC902_03925 [Calothrix sp. SM1_5_4]|nr:hypothetical protein [Calothrix sp. SM1_5_4]